jgi:hypothetical protein
MESIISTRTYRAETLECIYTAITDDTELEWAKYNDIIDRLCENGHMERLVSSDDVILYKAKTGYTWVNINGIRDPIERRILLQVIENPKCFFVLLNTQKGKLRIAGQEMASWSGMLDKRIVSFLIVDNDRTLSEQSVNGLFQCFPVRDGCETAEDPNEKYNVRIFQLSSNSKTSSLSEIITYIDAYAHMPSYRMPLIVILANNKQMEKFIKILQHIKMHPCKNLYAADIWDEADKTYPLYRDKTFMIDNTPISFLQFINEPEERTLFRTGFVTATEGDLIEEEYPECANAYHYPIVIDPADGVNYMSFHHPESVKKIIAIGANESNNAIAKRTLEENYHSHFNVPYTLTNGETYHHKVIINCNSTTSSHISLAKELRDKFHVFTLNMYGITLFTSDGPVEGIRYSTRKQNLNKILFFLYKKHKLHTKPLLAVGRHKVDRGLAFHYAPRRNGLRTTEIHMKNEICYTDGIEGLIFTDEILGNAISDPSVAVQKIGRGGGIIRQCPQYPGEFTYWIDDETSRVVERHYKKVDKVNELCGANTIRQAIQQAEEVIPFVRRNHSIDLSTFCVIRCATAERTMEVTKRIIVDVIGQRFVTPRRDESTGRFKTSLNVDSTVVDLLDAIKKVPGAYGKNPQGAKVYRRFLPCYRGNVLYTVIPLIDEAYTEELKARIREECREYLVEVPQEGAIP